MLKPVLRGILSIALVLICFLLPVAGLAEEVLPGTVMTKTAKVIRVGFPTKGQGGLSMVDEAGNYSGYTYDYLQEIAQYTGWEYEFVEFKGEDMNQALMSMLDMLAKGELDLVGGMVKNDYTQKTYDFSEYGYGFNYNTLWVPEENEQINEMNYQAVKGLRIALYRSSTTNKQKLEAFCELNNIDYELVECEDTKALNAALREGRADVMLGNDLTPPAGMRAVAQFNGAPFYFATTKGNSEIVNALNSTLLTIQQVKPLFDSALYDKYFGNRTYQTHLTEQEKQFIETAETLCIAVVDQVEPIQYVDSEGVLKGIAIDLLKRIQTETGMKMELIPAASYPDAIELLNQGKADAICGIPYDYALAQQHQLVMSNSFLNAQGVLLQKANTGSVSKSYGIVDRLQNNVGRGSETYVHYENGQECLEALSNNEIAGAYLNLYSAEYLLQNLRYKDLRLVPQPEISMEFCVGFKKPTDTMMISVFNKVQSHLPPEDLEAMIYQNTMNGESKVTFEAFVEENPFLIIGILTSVFIVFAVIGFLVLWMRIRTGRQLAVENRRYIELSNLANEFIYEYDYNKDRLSFSQEFATLFGVPQQLEQVRLLIEGKLPEEHRVDPHLFEMFRHMTVFGDDTGPEILCRLPSGEQRWYRSTQTEIKDREGTLLYVIGKITDVQKEIEEKERLEQRLLIDGLTGIYNSVASKDFIKKRLKTLDQWSALLIIDIDYFKDVNDRLGHFTGDIVLREVAELFRAVCAADDIAGRLGGDEFVLFIASPGGIDKLETFCTRLCNLVRKVYTNEDGDSCRVSISIGAVMTRRPCPFAELYQAADKLLYRSKEKGRDCFTISDSLDLNEQ